ncbi:hypothetical protein HZI73_00015 [Vallitalea pronyensis]|uniref:Zinc-ribbon domain-containing protein n=1 Tax=Vallitalea pronyensis TaxID=1348613 RepID=A0A8J8MFT4_9FIRM|nr:zinc ribbon domain-containing protein [Vallitalea pronyensis]QUI20790.1 hypothetical protein HZI73_00015 [Vallitalea pronyensis]
MGIIVKDKKTHRKYILLGTGFAAYKAVRPSLLGGNFFPHEEEGTIATVAVCDAQGNILWVDSNNLQVIEVDGIKITEMGLGKNEYCPACGSPVDENEKYCNDCGLTLIAD